MSITNSSLNGHCVNVCFQEAELVMELEKVKVSVHLRFTNAGVKWSPQSSAFNGRWITVCFHDAELVMELEEVKVSVHLRFYQRYYDFLKYHSCDFIRLFTVAVMLNQ